MSRSPTAAEPATPELRAKHRRLVEILRECRSVVVGYSGGVDSVYLAKSALDVLGPRRVLAVTGISAAYPAVQREAAIECARRFGIPHTEIETAELDDPSYTANAPDRCYHCKRELWTKLVALAGVRGYEWVLDGSNADDAGDYRPGLRAARELGVRSPLLEAGLTKSEIRELSRRVGLPTWDQPAAPCLASRVPYGLAVTPARLRQVEAAEAAVREAGFRELRVRHHGAVARVEVAPAELPRAAEKAGALRAAVRGAGFERVVLDLEGYRRGSLNEGLEQASGGETVQQQASRNEAVQPHPGSEPVARASGDGPKQGHAGRDLAERRARAERLLRERGLRARLDALGPESEIAAVAADPSQLAAVAAAAPEIRALGFRYVALDLDDTEHT